MSLLLFLAACQSERGHRLEQLQYQVTSLVAENEEQLANLTERRRELQLLVEKESQFERAVSDATVRAALAKADLPEVDLAGPSPTRVLLVDAREEEIFRELGGRPSGEDWNEYRLHGPMRQVATAVDEIRAGASVVLTDFDGSEPVATARFRAPIPRRLGGSPAEQDLAMIAKELAQPPSVLPWLEEREAWQELSKLGPRLRESEHRVAEAGLEGLDAQKKQLQAGLEDLDWVKRLDACRPALLALTGPDAPLDVVKLSLKDERYTGQGVLRSGASLESLRALLGSSAQLDVNGVEVHFVLSAPKPARRH